MTDGNDGFIVFQRHPIAWEPVDECAPAVPVIARNPRLNRRGADHSFKVMKDDRCDFMYTGPYFCFYCQAKIEDEDEPLPNHGLHFGEDEAGLIFSGVRSGWCLKRLSDADQGASTP